MRIRYTPRAGSDLNEIYSYLNSRSPAAARAVSSAIIASIGRLAVFPQSAAKFEGESVRVLSVARYPYKVFFSCERDEVAVLHIRDARRRPWRGTGQL